ncbi:MAG: putative toxin-antitoxin system toxin component, PIN family [Paludibacter sp.]
MENKSYKVIVDTNIWISFLIGKSLKGLQNHIDSHFIQIVTCDEQLQELSEVFKKPKIKKYFSHEHISDFFDLLDFSTEKITISSISNICRDAKDNYLISLAIDSNADFLLTGDLDLLILNKVQTTLILNYTDFDKIIKNQL